jgi:hypothetical protein
MRREQLKSLITQMHAQVIDIDRQIEEGGSRKWQALFLRATAREV